MRRNRIAYICAAAALSAAVFFGCENTAGGRGSSGSGNAGTGSSGSSSTVAESGGNVVEEMPSEPTAEKKFIGTWVKADEKETGDPATRRQGLSELTAHIQTVIKTFGTQTQHGLRQKRPCIL